MTSKTVYAVIAVIVIAIVAIGAALAFTGGNSGITGTYELQEGSAVILDGDDVKQEKISSGKLTIKSVDGDMFTGDWDGTQFAGVIINDNLMRVTSGYSMDGGETFLEDAYFRIVDKVLYYISLSTNEDASKTIAYSCVFAMDGAKADAPKTPLLAKGTVYESFQDFRATNGTSSAENTKYSVTVSDTYGFVSVLDHKLFSEGSYIEWKTLAIQYGSNQVKVGYNYINGSGSMFVYEQYAEIHYNFINAGKDTSVIFCMTSGHEYKQADASELAGKVYAGTANIIEMNGKKYSGNASFSFGDCNNGIFSVNETYKDRVILNQATVMKISNDKGYYVMLSNCYEVDGYMADDSAIGYVTADLSKMYLTIVTFYDDGSSSAARSVLSLTDRVSYLGTYDVRDGSEARLSGTDYVLGDLEVGEYDTFKVIYYDGDFLVAKWGPDIIKGAVRSEGGKLLVTAACGVQLNGYTFFESGEIIINNGVLIYNGVAIGADDKAAYAISAIFTKSGVNIALPEYTPILSKGDVYKSFAAYKTEDGQSVSESLKATVQVLDMSRPIYVLEVISEKDGKEDVSIMLAVQNFTNTLKGVFADERRLTDVALNGNNMTLDSCFEEDGKDILLRINLAKGEATAYTMPDLEGKVYTGIAKVFVNGYVVERSQSIVFGEYKDERITATVIFGDSVEYGVFQLFPVDSNGLYAIKATFTPDPDGTDFVRFYRGAISNDFSNLNLYGNAVMSDGSTNPVVIADTLVKDDTGLVGNYSVKNMYSVMEKGFSEYEVAGSSYGYYFTVVEVKDNIVRGSFFDNVYLGAVHNGFMRFFTIDSDLDMYASVKFVDGACCITTTGVTDDTSFSSVITCVKDGAKKVADLPVLDNVFKEGEEFIAYETICVVDGEETDATAGHVLECTYSSKGLNMFELTTPSGKTYTLTGYSKGEIVSASALIDGGLATYNIHKHSDTFVCMDRETTEYGKSAAIVFRMSDDGTPQKVHEYPSLEGYEYKGVWTYYTLNDGEVSVTTSDEQPTVYGKTVGSITTKISGSSSYPAHMFIDENAKLTKTESFSILTMGDQRFPVTYYCHFSDDCKTTIVYGIGCSVDGTPYVSAATLQFAGIVN